MARNPNIPTGTVSFLFTDIEGSTKLAQEYPDMWEALRERHHAIIRAAIEAHHGFVFQVIGDAFCSAFYTVRDGLNAAVDAQKQLRAEVWGEAPIQVRMGIHTGEAQWQDGEYRGYLTLAHAQRVMSDAYGGQVLLSNSSAELLGARIPAGLSLRDLGEHRLKGLLQVEHLWQVVSPALRQDFPALASLNAIPNNLPAELTSFIGRETEIREVRELLETHRLVTLTGSGGTGKTRLSLRVAREVMDSFRDGVWFIELAPLSDPALVPNTVASILGVREEQNRALMEDLLDWLESKGLLLVIDNCEHLIESSAKFADAVLQASRRSRILATSREALGIAGETAYHVPSLESPQPAQASQMPMEELAQYPAVRLFTERAKEAAATFSLTQGNAPSVAQICARLDGIPLAIELAAARVKILQAEEIAERLNDRFKLLTGGSRTTPARHQTLRSLIDWSYSLLSESERVLLRRLSVFAGGWTLDAAEQVCAGRGLERHEILDLQSHLADKSLVLVDEGVRESHYHMLETIRQYAREELAESGEMEQIHDQHLAFMLALMERAEPQLERQGQLAWLHRLELEVDNTRVALEWALRREDAEAVLRLAQAADWFWWRRGYGQESEGWLRVALERARAEKPTKARVKALNARGWFLYLSGDYAKGMATLQESVEISRVVGDKSSLVESLTWLGFVLASLGDHAAARPLLEEGLKLSRELGHQPAIERSLLGFGEVILSEGNYSEAVALFEESAAMLRATGDKNWLAYPVRRLAHLALRQANFFRAYDLCAESLDLNLELGDRRGIAASLEAIASIAAREGNLLRAAQIHGATAALLERFSLQLILADRIENEPYMEEARAGMGEKQYATAFSEGHAMSMDKAIAYALQRSHT